MILVLGLISFLTGAALAILGLITWGIFDFDWGEIAVKVGLVMMITPFVVLLFAGVVILLLSLFGLVVLI